MSIMLKLSLSCLLLLSTTHKLQATDPAPNKNVRLSAFFTYVPPMKTYTRIQATIAGKNVLFQYAHKDHVFENKNTIKIVKDERLSIADNASLPMGKGTVTFMIDGASSSEHTTEYSIPCEFEIKEDTTGVRFEFSEDTTKGLYYYTGYDRDLFDPTYDKRDIKYYGYTCTAKYSTK